jgi:hypothetical protein
MITMTKGNELRGACSMHGEMRNVYKILVGNLDGKRQVRRPRHRWADIKIDRKEGRVWTRLIWIRIRTSDGLL